MRNGNEIAVNETAVNKIAVNEIEAGRSRAVPLEWETVRFRSAVFLFLYYFILFYRFLAFS